MANYGQRSRGSPLFLSEYGAVLGGLFGLAPGHMPSDLTLAITLLLGTSDGKASHAMT